MPNFPVFAAPRPWETPEGMYAQGLEYFSLRKEAKLPFTISGLALHLGLSYGKFTSYGARVGYAPVVAILKSHILDQVETALYNKDTANGAKFHAVQLGMTEKSVIESRNLSVTATLSPDRLKDLPDGEIESLRVILEKLADPGASGSGDSETEAEQDQNLLPGPGAIAPGPVSEAS